MVLPAWKAEPFQNWPPALVMVRRTAATLVSSVAAPVMATGASVRLLPAVGALIVVSPGVGGGTVTVKLEMGHGLVSGLPAWSKARACTWYPVAGGGDWVVKPKVHAVLVAPGKARVAGVDVIHLNPEDQPVPLKYWLVLRLRMATCTQATPTLSVALPVKADGARGDRPCCWPAS